MQSRPGSFSWSEDLDETLNYWFWLRREGVLTDSALIEEVRESVDRHPFTNYKRIAAEARWQDYLQEWGPWKRDQTMALTEDSRATPAVRGNRSHYKAMAAVGLSSFRVQWVMAPFGERWLFPPRCRGARSRDCHSRTASAGGSRRGPDA